MTCHHGRDVLDNSLQVVHMTGTLEMKPSDAEAAFHIFTALCYLLPLAGAWLADRYLGKYAVILYLSGFYCLGMPSGHLPCCQTVIKRQNIRS